MSLFEQTEIGIGKGQNVESVLLRIDCKILVLVYCHAIYSHFDDDDYDDCSGHCISACCVCRFRD